jgi:hypothetical protein
MRYTLTVGRENASKALLLADKFLADYVESHCDTKPERNPVIVKDGGAVFYLYGNADHVRVTQDVGG